VTRHGVFRRTAGLAFVVVSTLALTTTTAFAGVTMNITAPRGPYEVGQAVTIDYSCTSSNPQYPVSQCVLTGQSGTLVPGTQLDTSTPGDFFVNGSVSNGEPPFGGNAFAFIYRIVAAQPPTVTLSAPADGARYSALRTLFKPVRVAYSCDDAVSGIASCTGTQPNGARLNTGFTALGRHSFTVTATDKAGNVTKVTHTYTVTL
jgi:hypothetical protein